MAFYKDPFRYRWLMLGVLGLIYFMACLHRIAPTIIAKDLVIEFGADATALGLMASTYFYLYAAVQPPVGILSDKIGPRKVATIFALIACAGCLVFALAPNMFMAGVGRGLVGIGVGGIFVPGLKIFSGWYKPTEFATVTGIFLALGNLGNLSGSLPLTYLVTLVGWRFSFIVIAGVALPLAFLAWWILRDKPEDKGWPPIVPHPLQPAPAAAALPADPSAGKGFGIIFKSSGFWMITLSYFFTSGPGLSFQGLWSVPYLMDVNGPAARIHHRIAFNRHSGRPAADRAKDDAPLGTASFRMFLVFAFSCGGTNQQRLHPSVVFSDGRLRWRIAFSVYDHPQGIFPAESYGHRRRLHESGRLSGRGPLSTVYGLSDGCRRPERFGLPPGCLSKRVHGICHLHARCLRPDPVFENSSHRGDERSISNRRLSCRT